MNAPNKPISTSDKALAAGLTAVFIVGLVLVAVGLFSGCSTVHQSEVRSESPGFYQKPMRVGDHYVVDDAFRDRYNALIAVYGASKLENGAPRFSPPLERDYGVSKGPTEHSWVMSFEAMTTMVILEGLKHRGAAP